MSVEAIIANAYALLNRGAEEEAIPALRTACSASAGEAQLWQALGLCLRSAERLGEAEQALARAREHARGDKRIAQGYAQCRLECGRDAVSAFEDALALDPNDQAIAQGLIAAVAAVEGPEAALARLQPMFRRMPDWLAGHWLASRLAAAAGREEPVDRTIAAEIARRPQAEHLWHHRLFTLMHSRQWSAALSVAREARSRFPGQIAFAWSEAAAASEAGDLALAERLYATLGPLPDMNHAVYRCRYWLRQGRPEFVGAVFQQLKEPARAEALCPYFAIAWRMLGDDRHRWLEPETMVGVYDLGDQLPPLDALTQHLRSLHNQVRQPLEQSVRGGTQTDGHLLLRDEPIIQAVRDVLKEAVARHVGGLPQHDPAHPQLRHRRDAPIRFAGSWSVRLRSGGHHDNHVHPEGWFSSALYIALPEGMGGDDRAGWLTLGEPQQSLGLDLPPIRMVEPKPGRLVLFPSTMWHGTVPFANGERLTVAFDVKVPPA